MPTMRRTWPLWAVIAWLAVAGPAASQPQPLGDTPRSVDGELGRPAAIAAGPDGLTTALVRSAERLVVRRARPGSAFGAAHGLPLGDHANDPTVAAGAGFAALAWTRFDASLVPDPGDRGEPCCHRVRAALIGRSGRMTRPQTLSAPGSNVDAIYAAVHGPRAAIVWSDAHGLRTSTGLRGVGFGRPATIASRVQQVIGVALPRAAPHVFVVTAGRDARIVEAWRSSGRMRRRTLGRFPARGSAFSAAASPAGGLLLASDVATRSRERRLVIVTRRPGERLRTVRLRLRGNPETPTTVVLAPTGDGLVVSSERPGRLMLRPVARSGRLSPARATAVGSALVEVAVATARPGVGVLAAILFGGDSHRRRDRVAAWPLRGGGRLGPGRTLAAPDGSVTGPLGVTADGRVTWQQRNGTFAALGRQGEGRG